MIDQAFAKVLRHLRKERGLSQEAFALEAGLHRTYVSQLERGLKSPSLRTIDKICRVLNIGLDSFITQVQKELADEQID